MLNEYDLFRHPTVNDEICYDDCMPPIYDNSNIYESGFGRVSTLVSNDSTISEEVSNYYDQNKVASYADYCDDTYVIKSSDNYCHNFEYPFTEHYSFNVGTIYSILVSYDTPTIVNENKIAYMESNKFSMLLDHEKNALCDCYMDESIHDATKNYY